MTRDSAALNQAAAHDTALYDPNIHDNQIVAMYDTDAKARSAKDVLVGAGFSAASLQVLARDGTSSTGNAGVGSSHEPTESEGIWGSIRSLFVPDQDRNTYNHAIVQGHAMLVVTPDHTMDRHHLIHVLESTDPLDFDAKLEEWRQSGYDSSTAMSAATMEAAAPTPVASPAPIHTGYVASPPAPHTTTAPTATAAEDKIQVLEETLRVGKREVAAGAVRIRSYIVERPVEESVRLHEETITVDRTPVDRPATAADLSAFQERTIEARATSEEAVIAKEARVIEEIELNKQATDRVETVHDTVRKTEVEIQGADTAATHGTLGSTTGNNPNSTPGATTSGANSPRK